jgi:putative flippase GtrA
VLTDRQPTRSSIILPRSASWIELKFIITDVNRQGVFRFVRFATVGATVALIDLSSVVVLSRALPPLVAVSIAYFIGVTCHFLLNKFWVFRCARRDYVKQLLQYGAVILINWIITVVTVQIVFQPSPRTFSSPRLAQFHAQPFQVFS